MAVYEVREVTSESGSYLDGFREVRSIKINEQLFLFQILEMVYFLAGCIGWQLPVIEYFQE